MIDSTPSSWEALRVILRDADRAGLADFERRLEALEVDETFRTAMEAQIACARGHPSKARALLSPARLGRPPAAPEKLVLGLLLLDMDVDRAAKLLEAAAGEGLSDPRLGLGFAGVAMRRRRFEEAAQWYQRVLVRDEREWRARYGLGLAWAATNQADRAGDAFLAVATEHPNFEPAWLGYASQSVRAGRGREAADALETVALAHRERPLLQMAYADCLRDAGEAVRAIAVLAPLVDDSDDASLLEAYAGLCDSADHPELAARALDRAKALNPRIGG